MGSVIPFVERERELLSSYITTIFSILKRHNLRNPPKFYRGTIKKPISTILTPTRNIQTKPCR